MDNCHRKYCTKKAIWMINNSTRSCGQHLNYFMFVNTGQKNTTAVVKNLRHAARNQEPQEDLGFF